MPDRAGLLFTLFWPDIIANLQLRERRKINWNQLAMAWSFFTIAIQKFNIKLEFSYIHSFHQIRWLSKGRLWERWDYYLELVDCTEIECDELLRDRCEKSIIARNRTVRFVSDGRWNDDLLVRSTTSRSSSFHLDAFATQSILRNLKFWKQSRDTQNSSGPTTG